MRANPMWTLALLLAGCGGSIPITLAPSPATTPTPAPAATLPVEASSEPVATASPSFRPTPTPVLGTICPTGSPVSVLDVIDDDRECFHGDFKVRGWLAAPPALGWEGPMVEPGWLYYPPDAPLTAVWSSPPIEPDHWCAADVTCGWFFIHVQPGSSVTWGANPHAVVLTGHFRDPAAATCHYVVDPSDPVQVDDAEAVRQCEGEFVVTALEDAPSS